MTVKRTWRTGAQSCEARLFYMIKNLKGGRAYGKEVEDYTNGVARPLTEQVGKEAELPT